MCRIFLSYHTILINSDKITHSDNADKPGLVAIDETRRFMFDCFLQSKTSKENAKAMADLLAEADYRG